MPGTLLVNAVSARAGGGLNDLVQTLPRLASALQLDGWSVQSFVSPSGEDALSSGCDANLQLSTVDAGSPRARAIWEFVRLPRIVRQTRPDVVFHFANFIFRDLSAPQLTVLRSQTFFCPDYAEMPRRGMYQRLRYRLGRHYSRRTIERAAAVFCISETQREMIVRTMGPAAEKLRVAHLGFTAPPEAQAMRGQPRAALAKRVAGRLAAVALSDRRIVVNVAHYYSHKNLGTLLEAMCQLHQSDPRFLLILTAGITDYAGPHTPQTRRDQALARQLASQGALLDLGPLTRNNVWPLLAMADVFGFPSSLESFGHPLLEAMAMGVPVVASDTAIHREICGAAAAYFPTRDPHALAARIQAVLVDPSRKRGLVAAGMENIERFSWDAHVKALVDAILQLHTGQATMELHA